MIRSFSKYNVKIAVRCFCRANTGSYNVYSSSWWFFSHPLEKYARQNGFIFVKVRGEHKKYLSCHHPVIYNSLISWISPGPQGPICVFFRALPGSPRAIKKNSTKDAWATSFFGHTCWETLGFCLVKVKPLVILMYIYQVIQWPWPFHPLEVENNWKGSRLHSPSQKRSQRIAGFEIPLYPRDPGSPKLRMVAWNQKKTLLMRWLDTLCSSSENMTGFL